MDLWNEKVAPEVAQIAHRDADYQELLRFLEKKQTTYDQILKKLSQEEQEMVEDYISACEELMHRFAQLSFSYGTGFDYIVLDI